MAIIPAMITTILNDIVESLYTKLRVGVNFCFLERQQELQHWQEW